ncbi:MAG: LTA synthase family protein [Lachnospiraceae bacterium]|nr:LTA synthase family protein [Lachnospiraceae bacterium]
MGSWLREEVEHYCKGISGWVPEVTEDTSDFVQSFVPSHKQLKQLGICFRGTDSIEGEGTVSFAVSDENGNTLFQETLSYDQISDSYYMFDVNLEVNIRKEYYITVDFSSETYGNVSLLLCGAADEMDENVAVYQGEVKLEEGQQLATWYVYENALTKEYAVKATLMILFCVFIIAVGCPLPLRQQKILAYILLLVSPYILGPKLEMLTTISYVRLENSMVWNIGLMYLFELILWLLLRNPGLTAATANGILTLIYTVNYFVYSYRGTSFRVSDLLAARTAGTVLGSYDLSPNAELAEAWLICLTVMIFGFALRRGRNLKWNVSFRVVGACTIIVSWLVLFQTQLLESQGFYTYSGFVEECTFSLNGYLVGSVLDTKRAGVTKPDGYSEEKVEEILADYEEEEVSDIEDLPHIILIMNESFSELRVLGNLEISEENMPFINSLSENTIKGYVNASGLGGGTANSEFEVFTGDTMAFLPTSYYPYFHCFRTSRESMVSQLSEYGYQTFSMHPMESSNYNRKTVYKNLGFGISYWKSDFSDAEEIHSGVSDLETYYKIEEIFENKEDGERLFVFDLTMQNHGGYESTNIDITVTAGEASTVEADIFLSLIKISDEAFGELVGYFEDYDEKVIICMFGDHQPLFSDDSFYETIYANTDGLTEQDKTLNQYKVPFVIWANYDIEEATDYDISMNYLGVLLMETAGVPMSSYFQYLSDLMEEYPIFTPRGYEDSEGNFYSWSEEETEFLDYRILQYYNLFD